MQLVTRRDRPDARADCGGSTARNPDDDFAGGEFARIGGDAGAVLLSGPVNESLRPDMFDGLNRQVEGDTTWVGPVRNHEILGPNAENAGRASRRLGELVAQWV